MPGHEARRGKILRGERERDRGKYIFGGEKNHPTTTEQSYWIRASRYLLLLTSGLTFWSTGVALMVHTEREKKKSKERMMGYLSK